jgi:hypothetical protein
MKYAIGCALTQTLEERIGDSHSEKNTPIVHLRK